MSGSLRLKSSCCEATEICSQELLATLRPEHSNFKWHYYVSTEGENGSEHFKRKRTALYGTACLCDRCILIILVFFYNNNRLSPCINQTLGHCNEQFSQSALTERVGLKKFYQELIYSKFESSGCLTSLLKPAASMLSVSKFVLQGHHINKQVIFQQFS